MNLHLATVVPCFVIGTILLIIKKGTQVKGYENVDYVCLIRIFDDLIGFSVAHHNELILWDKYIPNLLKEIK